MAHSKSYEKIEATHDHSEANKQRMIRNAFSEANAFCSTAGGCNLSQTRFTCVSDGNQFLKCTGVIVCNK